MSQRRRGVRVLIIGGGIGGLCLAQSLRRAGVGCTVFEQDRSPTERRQGYRLRISPEGEQALRESLPKRAEDLLVNTANARYEKSLAAYDEQLTPQWAPEFQDVRGEAEDKVDAVDRVMLRWVLLTDLGTVVRFGKRFVRYERHDSGEVSAVFDDGEVVTGDVLIAADGAFSRVREQHRPQDRPHDLGVRTVFGRVPMADAIAGGMPESLQRRFSYVIGADGHHLGLMPMVFRDPPGRVADRCVPELPVADAEDYFMAVFNIHRDELGMDDAAFFSLTGDELCEVVLERTAAWHPDLRGIFRHAVAEETFAAALRVALPIVPWSFDNVVAVGDAIHAMPPSGGVGANTALRDASVLGTLLGSVDRGERTLREAVDLYHKEMLSYATAAAEMSLKIARWSISKLDLPEAARP